MLKAFAAELVTQLDPSSGGFAQWAGHTDQRRLVLLADYLVQSVDGAGDALLDAALSARVHRESMTADNSWILQRMATSTTGQSLEAIQRNDHEKRRDRRINTSAVHTLIHLVQCLDRLAAMIVIAAGLKTSAIKVGWGDLQKWLGEPKGKKFDAPSTAAVEAQRDLVAVTSDWQKFGPDDWLPWLVSTRNATAHRAATTHWNLATVEKRRITGMARTFYRQPQLSEMHSLSMSQGDTRRHGLDHLLILKASSDTLDGLVDSTSRFAGHILERTLDQWEKRRSDPSFIVQPGTQWDLAVPTPLQFRGYGPDLNLRNDLQLLVGPQSARRLEAGQVLEDKRSRFWSQ